MDEDVKGTGETVSRDEIGGILKKGVWFSLFSGATPRSFIIELRGSIDDKSAVDVEVDNKVVAVLNRDTPATTVDGTKIRLRSNSANSQAFAARPL